MVLKYLVQLQLVAQSFASLATSSQSPISIISHLARKISDINHPHARACVVWLVGQYAASDEKGPGPEGVASWAPDVLREMTKNFGQESPLVKLQVLTLAAKLLVLSPHHQTLTLLARYVFSLARYDSNYDVRDRGRMLASLLVGSGAQIDGIQGEDRGGVILRREQVKLVLFEGKSGSMDDEGNYLGFHLPSLCYRIISCHLSDDPRILLGSLSRVTAKSTRMDDILPDWLEKGVESKIRDSEEENKSAPAVPLAISSTGMTNLKSAGPTPIVLTPTDGSRPSSSNGAKGAFKDLDSFYAEDEKEDEEEGDNEDEGEEDEEETSSGDDEEEDEEDEGKERDPSKPAASTGTHSPVTGATGSEDEEGETGESSSEDETNGLIRQ